MTQLTVKVIHGPFPVNGKKLSGPFGYVMGRFFERRMIGGDFRPGRARKVPADGVWNNEITVRQTLHQGTGPQTIGPVIRKIGFPHDKQSLKGAHQVVIHPQTPHHIMRRRVNHHGFFVRVGRGDFFVHLEQIAVFLPDHPFAVPPDGIGKIQVYRKTGFPHPFAHITLGLGIA